MRGETRGEAGGILGCKTAGNGNKGQQQPRGSVLFHSGDERGENPDQQRSDERKTQRAAGPKGIANCEQGDGGSQEQRAKAPAHGDGKRGVMRRVNGRKMCSGDECACSRAEDWRVREGAPSGGPDVETLIQIAGPDLFRNGG